VKAQAAERENWNCDKCRTEKVRMLQEDLQNSLRETDELKARNRGREAKLLMAVAGKRDSVPAKQKVTTCMVVGDSMLRNVGAEHEDMIVECFPWIKTEQPHRVTEKRDLGIPETVTIQADTNDLKITGNLNFVMGQIYA